MANTCGSPSLPATMPQAPRGDEGAARCAGEDVPLVEKAAAAVQKAGDAAHAAASEATAQAATVFLSQGGEVQGPGVPQHVAEANAERVGVGGGSKED